MAEVFQGELSEDQTLVLSGGFQNHEKVVQVTNRGSEEVVSLFSSQDEADTRIWLHVNDASVRYGTKTVIIWSPDTDVLVLGVHFFREIDIEKLCFKTGTIRNTRYIPVHMIVDNLGESLSRLILPFHAFTGCDSTSCFKWKGKKKGLELIQKEEAYSQLEQLGNTAALPESLIAVCTIFACQLYQPNRQEKDINRLRYKIFCKKP